MPAWRPLAAAVHALPQHTGQQVARAQAPAGSLPLGSTLRVPAVRALGGQQQRVGSCWAQVEV